MKHRGILLGLVLLLGTGWTTVGFAASKEQIFVTLPPQAFLAERIGAEAVEVYTLVDKSQDPHTFEPTPRQATALARAQIFFTVGLPFEERLLTKAIANNRNLIVVDSGAGIIRLPMTEHYHDDWPPRVHQESPDPHIWLAPANLRIMASNMAKALIASMPEHRELLRRRHAALDAELQALDQHLALSLAPYRGRTFYVFHPAFGYFAKAYGLTQEAVETGGKSPSPKQIAAIVQQARKDRVSTIFVQPQFNPIAATTVARSIGGTVVPIDPMAKEIITNLTAIGTAIGHSLESPATKSPGGQ